MNSVNCGSAHPVAPAPAPETLLHRYGKRLSFTLGMDQKVNLLAHRDRSLDGVRGVAVLFVLLHHHGYMNSGWLGVDLFFVLSGYLITTILRRTRREEHFWKEFWVKRATRILPALVLLLVASRILFQFTPAKLLAYLLSLGDVLAFARPFHPMDPLWSLAVEEHFYLLWPFAVRALSRRSLLYVLGGVLLAEPLLRAVASVFVPGWEFTYYLTPFRLDGLCFGCMLALCMEAERARVTIARWSLPGLFTAIFAWVALRLLLGDHFTRAYPGPAYNGLAYLVISFGAFSLISYLVTSPNSMLARVLSWRVLTFCGTISYGLYLYQLVIKQVVTSRLYLDSKTAFYIDLPLTFFVAWISFRFYERPLLLWGRKWAQRLRDKATSKTSPMEIQQVSE